MSRIRLRSFAEYSKNPKDPLAEIWNFLKPDLPKDRSKRYSALIIDGEVVETHHSHKHIIGLSDQAKIDNPKSKVTVYGPIEQEDKFQLKKGQRLNQNENI